MANNIEFHNFDSVSKAIDKSVKETLKKEVADYVVAKSKEELRSQVGSNGEKMPEKAEFTKREYTKYGWNTEDFLIRTGESTRLKVKKTQTGIEVIPQNPKILSYNIPSRVDWMSINKKDIDKIIDILSKQLKKDLK